MKPISLPGLDGGSLLGFLAGLGVLQALASTRVDDDEEPRLGWNRSNTWSPTITACADLDEVAARVTNDAHSDVVNDVLAFRYIKREKAGLKPVQALTPPVAVLRAAMAGWLSSGAPMAADTLGSLMCESAVEEIPEAKRLCKADLDAAGVASDRDAATDLAVAPTPFDFTSRNTQFVDQIRRVRDGLTEQAIVDELMRGAGTPIDRIMRWDALVDMPGALFDRARPMTRPVAEWLAFRGITFFPLVEYRGRARVAGLEGRRKSGELSWTLWSTPLPRDVVRTALDVAWAETGGAERAARGVVAGFTVSLRKDATGYDGAVSPSRPLRNVVQG